jgi:transcriptional regulator with XRE-family HTH domain
MARSIASLPTPQSPRVGNLHELGAIVRAQRTQAGLRIDTAAALCGVSVELLSHLENGIRPVRIDKLLQVLDSLGIALIAVPAPRVETVIDALCRESASQNDTR